MRGRTLHIVSRKYDGTFRFATNVEVLHSSCATILGLGAPGREVRRANGVKVRQDWSLEYLPLDKPYNIVSFFGPDGHLLYHFCNVLSLTRYTGSLLSYVDLDLDVVVQPDGSFALEDRDEFEANARRMNYPEDLVLLARDAAQRLEDMARQRGHVFGCSRLDEARALLLEMYCC